MIALDWLPLAPDFRSALAGARALEDPTARIQALVRLAQHRLGPLEVIQLERALGAASEAGLSLTRFAMLGSATLAHLVPGIRVAALRRGLAVDCFVGQFGQYRSELLAPPAALEAFAPHIVLLSVTANDLVGALPLATTRADAEAAVERAVTGLRGLWRSAREMLGATVLQQTVLDLSVPVLGSFDRQVPAAPAALIARLNSRLAEAASEDGVALVDVARSSERDGLDGWHDRSRWLQARMEISPAAAPAYGELVARVIAAQRGMSRKCLVLDLDNTLWGGVIGDDGLAGIILGEGSGTGEAHLALQRYAALLADRGVILAVCSKNDPAIAEAAFREHPEMHLRRDAIAAFECSWDDKAEGLRRIASRLNIGLDALVFVDDNPAERARIREALPMVAVPELPREVERWVPSLADGGWFEAVAFTEEDRNRSREYASNASREELFAASQDMDAYLRGLAMTMEAGRITVVELARVTQLINKTNQFNPTTRRYSPEEVEERCGDPAWLTVQVRLADRFGDNGLVSAALLGPADKRGVLRIDTWVMSCRVFGRQLERAMMNLLVEAARERRISALEGEYLPTAKNGVVRELYPSLGFRPLAARMAVEGASRWRLELDEYVTLPTHITRRTTRG